MILPPYSAAVPASRRVAFGWRLGIQCLWMTGMVAVAQGQDAPPAGGLVLWLKADAGVVHDSGRVMSWADQSAQANHAGPLGEAYAPTGEEAPALVESAINNLPVVRFDGVDDVLEIANAPSLQPLDGSWTVVVVARRVGPGQGDFPQIIGSRPWETGLDKGWAVAMDEAGLLSSHLADGTTGHDVPAVRSAGLLGDAAEIWQVEQDRPGERVVFYRRADLDQVVLAEMPATAVDQGEPVHVGREMGGANNRRAAMDLAEVLVYNRLLTGNERIIATRYLADRYGLGFTLNAEPAVTLTSPASGGSVAIGDPLVLEATATDADGTIERVEFRDVTGVLATATQPPYRATVRVLTPGTLAIKAVAVDNRGGSGESPVATVNVTGSAPASPVTDGLELWLRADAGVTQDGGLLVWQDQSGRGNHAAQAEFSAQPEWVADTGEGRPAFRFDGQDDYLEIANSVSLLPVEDSWTVFFTGQRRPGSQGDFPQVIGSRPWLDGLDMGWAVSFSAAGLLSSHLADGSTGHDVPQTTSATPLSIDTPQVWQVEENRTTGVVSFFRGGLLDRALAMPMPQGVVEPGEPVHIGREIGGANTRRASMDLSELMIYRGALDSATRRAVTAYLSSRAGTMAAALDNAPPTVVLTGPQDGATIEVPTVLALTAVAADTDGSLAAVRFFRGATLIGTRTEAPYTLSLDINTLGSATFTAVATDNLGASTSSAPITINFIGTPRGVEVGRSKLIGELQYSDTFTIGENAVTPERQAYGPQTFPLPFGVDLVENLYGGAEVYWGSNPFSIATDAAHLPTATAPTPGPSGAGSETGFTQRGGAGDWSLPYGLSLDFIVQFDYVQQPDRVDVTVGAGAGGIMDAGNVSIFFRTTGNALPEIGIFHPEVGEFDTGLDSGIAAANEWNNYAIRVNVLDRTIEVFTREVSRGVIDLNVLRDGAYAPYLDNANVGIGGAGNDRQWSDNFQVGLASGPGEVRPLMVTHFVRAADGATATLTFASQPGRTYAVDVSTNMTAAGQPGGWQVLRASLASQGNETVFTDAQAGTRAHAFYRVRDVTP